MSPPISKDWWLAAALTGATLPAALGQPAPSADRQPSGVVTTVGSGPTASASNAPLYVSGAGGQSLATGPNETVHVLFSDQSVITVGPNSSVVIAEYKYDAQSKSGNIVVEMTKGLLRVVGGFISKKSETRVRTPTATIGVRGGISIVEADGNHLGATFLFGQQLRVTLSNGSEQLINRPGFGVVTDPNGDLLPPQRVDVAQLTNLFGLIYPNPGGAQPGGGQGGGTLPDQRPNPSDLAPDRLPTNRDPSGTPNQNDAPPTLNQVLENPAYTGTPS